MEVTDRKPFFKGPRVTEKVRRRRKREARDKRERTNKQEARTRDRKVTRRGCRFPLCGCYKQRLFVEVSHLRHKAMGGNPKEDRSLPELLVCVCNQRHREGRIAIDKGTLECRPLTDAGTNGPVSWWVSVEDLMNPNVDVDAIADDGDGWMIVAFEIAPGVLGALEPDQQEILEFLARMEF